MKTRKISEQDREWLKATIKNGNYTLFAIVRKVSASGMQRKISFYTIIDNWPIFLDYYISQGNRIFLDKDYRGVIVNGCGMDMGLHIASNLSHELFGDDNLIKVTYL